MPSTSNSGHYDQALLSQAAAPTRQQMQEGYQTDLLNARPAKSSSSPSQTNVNAGSKEHLAGTHPYQNGAPGSGERAILGSSQRPTPFWRSRTGIIAIVVGLVVIIAIAVGVGVGVSRSNKNNNSDGSGGLESSTNTTDGGATSTGEIATKPSFTEISTTFTTTSTSIGPERQPVTTLTTVITTTTAVEVTAQGEQSGSPTPSKDPAAGDATSTDAAGNPATQQEVPQGDSQ
ncbi:hypothetical protein D9758_012114 [Tetrapyrgos nigripes]|uniref:Uncharacterized protein n=1 Tax=Tetrapyrgos nigripes TaxID=182062 RepID=A0A8H5CLC4_9AGAR|nr:hypothetical protein D9758_012114 [Tetrapyrgos nigripes]